MPLLNFKLEWWQPNGVGSLILNTARCCGRVCRVVDDVEGFGLLWGVMVDWRRKRFFDVARLDLGEMSFGGEVDRLSKHMCIFQNGDRCLRHYIC